MPTRPPQTLAPPSPATVEMAQVHREIDGLLLRHVMPRFEQSIDRRATLHAPVVGRMAPAGEMVAQQGRRENESIKGKMIALHGEPGVWMGSTICPGSEKQPLRANGRDECVHHCILCGAAVPPWRDACAAHEARWGRGMPPAAQMTATDVAARPTARVAVASVSSPRRRTRQFQSVQR